MTFPITVGIASSATTAEVTASFNGSTQTSVVPLITPPSPQPPGPVISGIPAGIVDAASYTPKIAQGSVFVVLGSHFALEEFVNATSFPLPTALNGTSILFTPAAGGSAITPYLIYASSSQIVAILPSATAPGSYNATVTGNGVTSAAVPVTVVPRKFELFTGDSSGSGAAAVQTVDATGTYYYNRFTTATLALGGAGQPAHPGDSVIAYGTGLGPISTGDQTPPGAIDFSAQASVQVFVGGRSLTPLYAGRSPDYPGLDRIDFQLPVDISTGCTVALQVSVAGQLSYPATIAIAPAGAPICGPAPISNDVLSRLDQGGSLTLGSFWLTQLTPTALQTPVTEPTAVNEGAVGAFAMYTGFQLASAAALMNPPGSCQLSHTVGDASRLTFGAAARYLDAGSLTLSGPAFGGPLAEDSFSRLYSLLPDLAAPTLFGLNLPFGFPSFDTSPRISPGAYQLTGNGGADVGAFSAAVTMGQPFSLSSILPLSIDRSKDLTLSWTGGNPGDLVYATGISGTTVGGTANAPIYDAVTFTCTVAANADSVTVPATLLAQLPVTPAARRGIGYLGVTSGAQSVFGNGVFAAPLTAGGSIDAGLFFGTSGVFGVVSYE